MHDIEKSCKYIKMTCIKTYMTFKRTLQIDIIYKHYDRTISNTHDF